MITQQMVDSVCLQIQDLIIERNDALELIQQQNGKIKFLEEANLELFNKAMQYLDERDALKALFASVYHSESVCDWREGAKQHVPKIVVFFEPFPDGEPDATPGWAARDRFNAAIKAAKGGVAPLIKPEFCCNERNDDGRCRANPERHCSWDKQRAWRQYQDRVNATNAAIDAVKEK